MTPEQINIAIAEACGWNDVGFSPSWDAVIGTRYEEGTETYAIVPNYCTDLNAMHKAEKTLDFSQCKRFTEHLKTIGDANAELMGHEAENFDWHSTAMQRAEAFLRTFNKWEDQNA